MPDVMTTLPGLVARVTRHPADEITADSPFTGLGRWGSLVAVRLLATVEQAYGVRLDLRHYLTIRTVGELAAEIDRRLETRATPAG
ncbi:acyl carrier protein [Streptomyces griseoviridis]|uniref:Acyl carrier protein n=1 Tax=Streptomyces hintoniae TaxID=3075521 RepID=A0ABU2UET6_9ACTN|nr:acyl carrier protein [Streptomyces sp. DSM 41014]MDT0471402.1 acyl carrier protein [Streptomyces sp. DSM 41014]